MALLSAQVSTHLSSCIQCGFIPFPRAMTSKSHAGTSSSSKTGFLGGTPSSSSGQRAPGDPWTKRKAICFKMSTTPWCSQKRGKIKTPVWKRGLRGAPSRPRPIAVTKSSRSGEDPLVGQQSKLLGQPTRTPLALEQSLLASFLPALPAEDHLCPSALKATSEARMRAEQKLGRRSCCADCPVTCFEGRFVVSLTI